MEQAKPGVLWHRRYVTTLKRPVYLRLYLPMLKWLNKDAKGLPVEQLQAVRRSIRHASRCLWTLSLAVGAPSLERCSHCCIYIHTDRLDLLTVQSVEEGQA